MKDGYEILRSFELREPKVDFGNELMCEVRERERGAFVGKVPAPSLRL